MQRGAATARVDFARLCLAAAIAATPRDDCSDTIVAGEVSVADCIANPYRLECYGSETARNPDFIEEVAERDKLCTSGDIYSDLCTLNGVEIIEGVIAAREAGCTTSVELEALFDDNKCDPGVYAGTDAARRQHCSTDAKSGDAVGICSSYEDSICGDEITANPFADLCGDNNGTNQATFCMIANNPAAGCSDVATVVCPNDPFNPTAGFAGMTDCLTGDTYLNDRAALCAAGTEGVGNDCTVPKSRIWFVWRRAKPPIPLPPFVHVSLMLI